MGYRQENFVCLQRSLIFLIIIILISNLPRDTSGSGDAKTVGTEDKAVGDQESKIESSSSTDPHDLSPASTNLMGLLFSQGWSPPDNEALLVSDWSPWSARKKPFLPTSTHEIYNARHKHTYHHHAYHHGAEYGRILKAQYGGFFVAAIIQVVAAVLFVQGFLGAHSSSDGTTVVPPHFDLIAGAPWSPTVQQTYPLSYGHTVGYQSGGGGGHSSPSYKNLYRNSEGYQGDVQQGRSVGRYTRQNNLLRSDDEIFSSSQKNVGGYWRRVEACAEHAMCIRGRELRPKFSTTYENGGWPSGEVHTDGARIRKQDDELGHTNFEQILETMNDLKMKGLIQSGPIFPKLYKAFKVGQSGSSKCSRQYKQCSSATASRISKTLRGMDDYLHL